MNQKAKLKFLVCVNEKEHSKTALKFACTRARVTGSEVKMIYVIDPVDYNTIFSVADVIKEDRKINAEKLLNDLEKEAYDWSGIKPEHVIREGGIVEEIVSTIHEDECIGLLVLGVAADGSKGGLLNHLTSEIGDKYHIPLVVVPGNLTNDKIKELS